MRPDEQGVRSGRALFEAAGQAQRPPVNAIRERLRRREQFRLASIGIVVLMMAGGVYWMGVNGTQTATEPTMAVPVTTPTLPAPVTTATDGATTTTTPPPEALLNIPQPVPPTPGIIPPAKVEGDLTTLDVTFPDGRHVFVEFPTRWGLHRQAWNPQIQLRLEHEELGLQRPRFAQVSFSWDADDGWAPTFLFRPEWTDEQKAMVPDLFAFTAEANGFVTVDLTPPLSLEYAVNGAWMHVGDVLVLDSVDPLASGCPEGEPFSDPGLIHWCDADAHVLVTFYVAPEHHLDVLANLDLRNADSN